jgi:O-antigen ligase
MHILFRAFLLIVALSVVVILVNPGYGTMGFVWHDRFPDAWKGFMHHKQALAAISASGTLVCLAMLVSREGRRRVLWLSGMVGFMFVVVMAKSAAALAALFVAVVIVWTLPRLRRFQFRFLWVCILMTYAGVITAFVVTQWLPIFTDLVGRDATLTGRVSIWEDALGMIAERPLIGFGYEAVWTPPGGTHLPQFEASTHASHAHNGYLNIATQAGIPAALLAASFVVVTLYRAMRAYYLAPSSFLGFSVGYLLMFAIMSMAGSTLFGYQEFEWVLFMAVSVAITRIVLDRVGSASRSWRRTAIPSMTG